VVDLRLVAVVLRWIVHQTAPNTGELIFVIPSVFGLFSYSSVLLVLTKTIGAPGFEPGTSPTRTARATRLRHAPTPSPVSHTALLAVLSVSARTGVCGGDPRPGPRLPAQILPPEGHKEGNED
jgi:hypothetical protein